VNENLGLGYILLYLKASLNVEKADRFHPMLSLTIKMLAKTKLA
jgi:hypothetical protein